MNTNVKVIGLTQLGIKPESTAQKTDALLMSCTDVTEFSRQNHWTAKRYFLSPFIVIFYLFQTTRSIVTKSYQKESRKIYIHKIDTVTFSHLLYRPYRDNDYNNQSEKTHQKSSTQILTYSQNESTEKQMITRIF